MTFYTTTWQPTGTWQPAGDYRLDWDLTGADGTASLSSASGAGSVGVTVSTPTNGQCDSFSLKDGQLYSDDVSQPTISEITFDQPVTDVNFQLIDVDQGCGWDDKVTVLAYDADGNLMDVDFQNLQTGQQVSGNTIEGEAMLCDQGTTVSVAGPVAKLVIVHDNGGDATSSGHVAVTDLGFNCLPEPEGDGIVEGTDGDDLIDLAYTGDPHGDMVDHDDALLPGEVGDDDIILAKDGDDTVIASEGDDEIHAGSGDDTVEGGAGDDVIWGDNGGQATGDTTVRESFNWQGVSDAQVDSSFTQDTGSVSVTYTRIEDTGTHFSEPGTDPVNGTGIDTGGETLDTDSSLHSETGGYCGAATFAWEFSDAVSNVEFNVNDLDGDGVVTIRAYDAEGNEIPVQLVGGSCLTLLDGGGATGANIADSKGGYAGSDSNAYNLQVTIAGPVSKIVLEHDQNGPGNSGINVTDLYFDVTVPGDAGEDGNDALFGGDGDDVIYGEGGEDFISGGAGADTMSGGDDRDWFGGGTAGDHVDGGAGGDDWDTLDLSGDGPVRVVDQTTDADGNSTSGTVQFLDGDGNVTGEMTFTEIEQLILPENQAPEAEDDDATVDEDGSVTIDVLGNDRDPDGNPLVIDSVTDGAHGTVTVNADGTVTYSPDPDYNGPDSFTYTVSDGNGGYDTATVNVEVAPVNDAPDAVDDNASAPEDGSVVIDVLGNDGDVDGDPLVIDSVTDGAHGTVTVNPDGTVTYTPDPDYVGPDSFTYTVTDGNGGYDTATVNIDVTEVNEGPDAVDDSARTAIDTTVTIAVLGNDSDPDGDALTVIDAQSADGTVDFSSGTTIDFTPNPGFDGEATITYTISDGHGGFDTATVRVMVADGVVEGTAGDDLIDTGYTGDPEGDMVDNGDALLPGEVGDDDIIEAYDGDDVVYAGLGDDEIDGGAGDDTLYGAAGNDTIVGGDGSDKVFGGGGDDVIDTSGSNPASDYGADLPGTLFDVIEDTDKTDDIDYVDGGAGNDTISTGDDRDTILGGAGNDTIDGGLDDDTIDGGTGDDTIIGGHGSDTIDGGDGNDTIWGGLGANTDPFNIQDVNDPLWGIDDPRPDNGIDVIHGGAGDDVIYGQDDDDVLYGDDGADFIDGGIDEDEIHGGTGNDTLLGGQGNDALFGDDGDDVIEGGTGEDFINGGAGTDTMSGGDDRDWFAGVNAGDTVDGGSGGDDWDTLDLTGSAPAGGSLNITYTTADQENGYVTYLDADGNDAGTLEFYDIEKVIPCFTPGTRIATPKGEVPVESLKAGDRVITRDNGIQEIKWVGHKPITFKEIAAAQHLAPIMIRAGALGNGLPERDMMLSPNHRVLVANDRTSLYFDEREVLAAAKHLVDNKGVKLVEPMNVTYVHFMCEHHEVVLSDGAWTESFQPGDHSLKGVGNAQRQELFELFPELATEEGLEDYAAARRILKKHEAQMLLRQ